MTEAETKLIPRKIRERLIRIPWVAALILATVVFSSIFAPLIAPHDPYEIHLEQRFMPPSWQQGGDSEYLLGTDTLGRDVFSRIIYGARVSLLVAVLVLLTGGLIGLSLGIIAGYFGGVVGVIIMRAVDGFMAIPLILIALVFTMTLKPSMSTVVIAISAVIWARFARVIRGEVISIVNRNYILQAKVVGTSPSRIMLFHTVPNVLNVFFVLSSLNIGHVIIAEASLSFLGAGIPAPTTAWGQMVAEGRGYITTAWWISFFPGLALAFTVLAVNLLGDWLRDTLDPKLRQH